MYVSTYLEIQIYNILSGSPETAHLDDQAFKEFDQKLENLVREKNSWGSKDPTRAKFSFLDLKRAFRIKGGEIKTQFFKPKNVHLNEKGAKLFAMRVFDHTKILPENFFD